MSKLGDAYLWLAHDLLLLAGAYLFARAWLLRRKVRKCARCGASYLVHECAVRKPRSDI